MDREFTPVLCPKDGDIELEETQLAIGLTGQRCSHCDGVWLSGSAYEAWRDAQPAGDRDPDPSQLEPLSPEFQASPYDGKGALCPECRNYLTRAKVGLGKSFYLDHCKHCGGTWCDRGEWPALGELGLQAAIDKLFSSHWQERIRQRETFLQEHQALIDKLGPELAETIFNMASLLEAHPNGDFAVAYLMRRFDNPQTVRPKAAHAST